VRAESRDRVGTAVISAVRWLASGAHRAGSTVETLRTMPSNWRSQTGAQPHDRNLVARFLTVGARRSLISAADVLNGSRG